MSDATLHFTDAELQLLREKYRRLTDVEFESFLAAAKRYQLNPLANQIYARLQEQTPKNPRNVTYSAQIDGYRLIADRTGLYAGNDDPTFDREDQPNKATVAVYKIVHGQKCKFEASARMKQYRPAGNAGFMWERMPHLMLGKCAEALALRKAFPAELSGLYTVEEMEQAEEPPSDNPFRDEQKRMADKAPPPEQQAAAAPTVTEIIGGCQSAAALAKFLQESVGRWPVAKFAEKWPKLITLAEEKLAAAQWPAEQAAIVSAVLAGVRNELSPLAGNPANAPSLERLVGWVDNQESPQDLLNVAASIEGSAKFSDLRANAARMLDVIDAIDVHASALVKGGAWTEDDFDELKRRLLAMNRKYQLEVQSTEAFGGGNEAQEVTV